MKIRYERHASDQFQNYWQNLTLKVTLQAADKQKEFSGVDAKEFAQTFKVESSTAKIVGGGKKAKDPTSTAPSKMVWLGR